MMVGMNLTKVDCKHIWKITMKPLIQLIHASKFFTDYDFQLKKERVLLSYKLYYQFHYRNIENSATLSTSL
jgi:hypothetical protein